MRKRVMVMISLGILLLGACATLAAETTEAPEEVTETSEQTTAPTENSSEAMESFLPLELSSTAFTDGEPIPLRYSCDGEDISPPLTWGDPPTGTQSFALIMDDPDAPVGTWDHWIVFNIPADVREFPEAVSSGNVSATLGKNSWGRNSYGGPCPPGGTHRYFFKLYALDIPLSLDENANKEQVLSALEGHILAEAELMGTFSR
ncbi:MAG: YbhB/YbcL family Raf kinase inhibitor-like protein [Anaerolineales bacterium]